MTDYLNDRRFGAEFERSGMRLEPSTQLREIPGEFWKRFIAAVIDGCILAVLHFPVSSFLMYLQWSRVTSAGTAPQLFGWEYLISWITGIAVTIIYYGWFYANKGATPGKMVMNLRVVDERTGANISWGQAAFRETIAKFFSWVTLGIGYLMIAFRYDKRGLHDLMCGSKVVHQRAR